MAEDDEGQDAQQAQIIMEPQQMAGVWANFANVSHSEHEFTLDFVRLDPIQRGRGIVVARVAVSPLLIDQLREALRINWAEYVSKSMPQEVRDAEERDEDQPEGEGA